MNKEDYVNVSVGFGAEYYTQVAIHIGIFILAVVVFIWVYSKVILYFRRAYLEKIGSLNSSILKSSTSVSEAMCRTWSKRSLDTNTRTEYEWCQYCYGDKKPFNDHSFVHDDDCPVYDALHIKFIKGQVRNANIR